MDSKNKSYRPCPECYGGRKACLKCNLSGKVPISPCLDCDGKGRFLKPAFEGAPWGVKVLTCEKCNGLGIAVHLTKIRLFLFKKSKHFRNRYFTKCPDCNGEKYIPCSNCSGEGTIINHNPCKQCKGRGIILNPISKVFGGVKVSICSRCKGSLVEP